MSPEIACEALECEERNRAAPTRRVADEKAPERDYDGALVSVGHADFHDLSGPWPICRRPHRPALHATPTVRLYPVTSGGPACATAASTCLDSSAIEFRAVHDVA